MPGHWGILGGPIPARTAHLMGLRFDRINLVTRQLERLDPTTGVYHSPEAPAAPTAANTTPLHHPGDAML